MKSRPITLLAQVKHLVIITLSILYFFSDIERAHAQIDITQYASKDLFKVESIIGDKKIVENEDKEAYTSQFDYELKKGFAHWGNTELNEALSIFETLISEHKEVHALHYYAGQVNYESGHYEEAKDYFEEAFRLEPLFLESKYMLGLTQLEMKEEKGAKRIFEDLITVESYKAFGYHGIGLWALNTGNAQKAYNSFKKSIQSDPLFIESYVPMVVYDLYRGRVKTAREIVESALEVKDDWEQGIIIRALIATEQENNTDQFEKDIDRLIELAPYNFHYISIKGYLQVELGNYGDAILNSILP